MKLIYDTVFFIIKALFNFAIRGFILYFYIADLTRTFLPSCTLVKAHFYNQYSLRIKSKLLILLKENLDFQLNLQSFELESVISARIEIPQFQSAFSIRGGQHTHPTIFPTSQFVDIIEKQLGTSCSHMISVDCHLQ